jgi:hypothetical protein
VKKLIVALLLLALLGSAALLGSWLTLGVPTDGIHLVINGHELTLAELDGWHAAAGGLALLFGLGIVALAVPLTLLLGLLLPLLLVLGAASLVLGAALGIGALALSPLLLPLLLLAWLWRRSRRAESRASRAARTTIDA